MSFLLWRGTLARARVAGWRGAPAARLFFVAQLGKYLPGSVWPVVAQMRMGRELGIPRQRTALAFLLTLGLSVLVGMLVGLSALPALLRGGGPRACCSACSRCRCCSRCWCPRCSTGC